MSAMNSRVMKYLYSVLGLIQHQNIRVGLYPTSYRIA